MEIEQVKSNLTLSNKVFVVSRTVSFYALHNLEGRDVHIHKFDVTLTFSGTRDYFSTNFNRSLLINYFDVDKLWKIKILPELVDSNKRIIIKNSTCEVLAEWIFDKLLRHKEFFSNCSLDSVKVSDGDISVQISLKEEG
jgi:6-pyruvoyl-tetrahydropterin synthase